MGQLTKGDLLEKLSSEEFLKMIVEEFQKLIKNNKLLPISPRNLSIAHFISNSYCFNNYNCLI